MNFFKVSNTANPLDYHIGFELYDTIHSLCGKGNVLNRNILVTNDNYHTYCSTCNDKYYHEILKKDDNQKGFDKLLQQFYSTIESSSGLIDKVIETLKEVPDIKEYTVKTKFSMDDFYDEKGVVIEVSQKSYTGLFTDTDIVNILEHLINCHNNVARFVGRSEDQIILKYKG